MAAKGISSVNVQRYPRGFMSLLSSAACEWLLMFMMFIYAALSYLLTRFAHYCELPTPCPVCSRLDHYSGNEEPGSYWSVICSNHRAEISALISCHIHNKLVDVRSMCEECFMSVAMAAMQNKSGSESYKSLVGKLGMDFEQLGYPRRFLNKNFIPGFLSKKTCSCCHKPWIAKSTAQRLLQLTSVGLGASKANVKPPLPRVPGRSHLSRRDSFKKIRDKFSGPITPCRAGNTSVDALSHVGYTELKITSDSESEVPFSDDDDGTSVAREKIDPKAEFIGRCGSVDMAKAVSDNESLVKQTHQASDSGPSLLDQSVQLDVPSLASDPFEEHNWEQPNATPSPYALPELISLDDVHQSSNVSEVPFGVSAEKSNHESPSSHNLYVLSELMPLNEIPPQSNFMGLPIGVSPQKSLEFIGANDEGNTSITKPAQLSESSSTTTGARVSIDVANDTDQTGASKLVSSNEGQQFSGMLAQRLSVSDSAKVVEDLKFLSPILSTHEMGSSSHASPRAHDYHDRVHRSDASSSDEARVFQRSASLERNDLGYESPDGSSVSEIEGESAVDRLKRQVEYDRRCMSSLYRELEEERSASAVAANQAMAMITRLQEEKAALHMEALQYLRMMEEQAEYDMDALQKANDLLAEKEKEVQDLEAELELQRNNFTDESATENLREENCNLKDENMALESSATVSCESTRKYEGSGNPMDANNSFLHFEDEKLYISVYLKNLERKLHIFSSNLASSDMPNGFHLEKITSGIEHKEEHSDNRRITHINHQKAEYGLSVKKNLSESNGSSAQKESITSIEDNHVVCEDGAYLGTDKLKSSIHDNKFYLAALEKEIFDLNERLQAFEADHDFLEHVIKTLQNGNEGLQYIQEIATQLQELRKDECKRRRLCVP